MHHGRLLLAIVVAAALLALGVATASANRLSVSNPGIRIVWARLSFGAPVIGTIGTCAVTLEGTLHARTFVKVGGSLVGHITRAIVSRPCETGENAWFLTRAEGRTETLPWHIRYDSFQSTLPRIASVRLQVVGLSTLVEVEGTFCLYRSTAAAPSMSDLILTEGTVSGVRALPEHAIPYGGAGEGLCPTSATFSGLGSMTLLGNTTPITLRLI